MKLMRSRFRLISLLLTCFFLLTAVLCAASALREAGVLLPFVTLQPSVPPGSAVPGSEASGSETPGSEETPAPPDPENSPDIPPEGTGNPPDSEYNIFGL